MAEDKVDGDKGDAPGDQERGAPGAAWNMDAIPEGLQRAGRRAADLAQNPYARSLLAAGLVTATAAIAANKSVRDNVRDVTRRNLKDAAETAEVAAENASRIGAAIIDAATDAVQRMMNLGTDMASAASAAGDNAPQPPQPPQPSTTLKVPEKRAAETNGGGAVKPKAKSGARKAAGATAAGGAGGASGKAAESGAGKKPGGTAGKRTSKKAD